jgi:hypothetical protein
VAALQLAVVFHFLAVNHRRRQLNIWWLPAAAAAVVPRMEGAAVAAVQVDY